MNRPARAGALSLARALAGMLLIACLVRSGQAAEFRFTVSPDTLRADSLGVWQLALRLENLGQAGLYPDSLALEWRSDAPIPGSPMQGSQDLALFVRVLQPVGAGENTGCSMSIPAPMDRGRLTLRLRFLDAQKRATVARQEVVITGNELAERYPSQIGTVAGRAIELLHVPARPGGAPSPGLVVLPPAGVGARSLLRWALGMRDRGLAVTIVSPPGAGASAGPDDCSGEVSVTSASEALTRLAKSPDVDASRLLLWGEGSGATTALLAAARQKELAGVVALNATFDPWAAWRAMDAKARDAYVAAAGRDSAAWLARSPLAAAPAIAAPVLVLHTEAAGPADAAGAFIEARAARKLSTESRVHARDGQSVRRTDSIRFATDFLMRRTRAAAP